jgi:hypothetical protein
MVNVCSVPIRPPNSSAMCRLARWSFSFQRILSPLDQLSELSNKVVSNVGYTPELGLSIPIVSESVSNWVFRSVAIVALACIARTVIESAVRLGRQPARFRLFR